MSYDSDISHSELVDKFLRQKAGSEFSQSLTAERSRYVLKTLSKLTEDVVLPDLGYFFSVCQGNKSYIDDIRLLLKSSGISDHRKVLLSLNLLIESNDQESIFNKNQSELENIVSRKLIKNMYHVHILVVEIVYGMSLLKIRDSSLPDKEFREVADRVMGIYSPIANRLGLWKFKWQLEDLYLKTVYHNIYHQIANLINETRLRREKYTLGTIKKFSATLTRYGFEKDDFDIRGRSKGIYSTYMKMMQLYCYENNADLSKLSLESFNDLIEDDFHAWFGAVHDLIGLRILCTSKELCYQALVAIEEDFPRKETRRRPKGELVDYIASPKPNKYQSLHIVVEGPEGKAVEVQIRTHDMHEQAEYGVAAHWKYKESGKSTRASRDYGIGEIKRKISKDGLPSIQNWIKEIDTSEEEPSEVYTFTPKGDMIILKTRYNNDLDKNYYPTPVDFAYYIHTEMGHRCFSAKVNGKMVPLDTSLKNGDIVEIEMKKNAEPTLGWLEFVSTPKALNRIRYWYKTHNQEQTFSQGKSLLEKALGSKSVLEEWLRSETIETVAKKCNYPDSKYMLSELACKAITTNKIINTYNHILAESSGKPKKKEESALDENRADRSIYRKRNKETEKRLIVGTEGLMYHLAKCCNPTFGDDIVGVISRTKGMAVHCKDCQNLSDIDPGRLINSIYWRPETFDIRVYTNKNYPGVLKAILVPLSEELINVESCSVETRKSRASIDLSLQSSELEQVDIVLAKISEMVEIDKIEVLKVPEKHRSQRTKLWLGRKVVELKQ